MPLESIIYVAGASASAVFAVAFTGVFAQSQPDLPNWANAGIAALAFGAIWVLHRETLNRFEARFAAMHADNLVAFKEMQESAANSRSQAEKDFAEELRLHREERARVVSAFTEEVRLQRTEFFTVFREITTELKAMREQCKQRDA